MKACVLAVVFCVSFALCQVSFVSDWVAKPYSGGWAKLNVVASTRLMRDVNVDTWHGVPCARVEVRNGDRNPCGTYCSRTEVAILQTNGVNVHETASSGTVYFATSYKIPSTFQGKVGWKIMAQLHGPDSDQGHPPAFSLNIGNGNEWRVALNTGDVSTGGSTGYSLTEKAVNFNKWTDFVWVTKFTATNTGSYTMWRRDEGETVFTKVLDLKNVATLQYLDGSTNVGSHYWKQGIYRQEEPETLVFWMGPFARASTFAAAENAAFRTSVGPDATGVTRTQASTVAQSSAVVQSSAVAQTSAVVQTSVQATTTPTYPPYDANCFTFDTAWNHVAIKPDLTKPIQLSFTALVFADISNIVVGLSEVKATTYNDISVAARLSMDGLIDARNYSAYAADKDVTYQPRITYSVVVEVNFPAKTFSVRAGSDIVASSYMFRDTAFSPASLNWVVVVIRDGASQICDLKLNGVPLMGSAGSTAVAGSTAIAGSTSVTDIVANVASQQIILAALTVVLLLIV